MDRDDEPKPVDSPDVKDPMSGYASADAMDDTAPVNRHEEVSEEPAKDSMSGYASADALKPDSDEEPLG